MLALKALTWSLSQPVWVAVQVRGLRLWLQKLPKELGILTVAVVTRPFDFEGKKRAAAAEQGINGVRNCRLSYYNSEQ